MGAQLDPTARAVLRCAKCQLVQFETACGLCRRCRASLAPEPAPAPRMVVVTPPEPAREPGLPDVAGAIRHWRRQCGLSQRQLAERMHVPRTYVSKIENDKAMPTVASLHRMATAMRTDVATLLQCTGGGSEDEVTALLRDGFLRDLAALAPSLAPAQMRQLVTELRSRAEKAAD